MELADRHVPSAATAAARQLLSMFTEVLAMSMWSGKLLLYSELNPNYDLAPDGKCIAGLMRAEGPGEHLFAEVLRRNSAAHDGARQMTSLAGSREISDNSVICERLAG
jgi:hypothetical protein